MKKALRELAFHYFEELNNTTPKPDTEDLYYRADRFVEDVQRILSARRDFQEED